MNAPRLCSLFGALTLFGGGQLAVAQVDDFDDGNDEGWSRLAPLAADGVTATFSFPDGGYRLQSAANTVSDALGPPRMGSLREDVSYTDFYIAVDIKADPSIDQNIGLLARVKEPGLGSLDGYAVTWNPSESAMFMTVITDEDGENIADGEVFVPDGENVRMVFQGKGNDLKLEIFSLADPLTPLATLESFDATYSSGICGIFHVSDPIDAPTDSTFDNYFAAAAEPSEFEIVDVRLAGDDLEIEFLSKTGRTYAADGSEEDGMWDEIDDGIVGALGDRTVFTVPLAEGETRLYRIRALE